MTGALGAAPALGSQTEGAKPRKEMTVRTLIAFFSITFVLGWGVAGLAIAFQEQAEGVFGEIGYTNPLFIFVVYSPAIAGVFLVGRHYGAAGLLQFIKRLTLWRMPAPWWAFLILGIPAIVYAGAALKGTFSDPFPFSPWYGLFPAVAIALAIGPVEELGWRGVALPLLQRRFAPLWAGLILGAFWGLWHAPAFLLSGTPQSSWSFAPYVIGVLAVSVIVTPLFNSARGSILVAALFHLQVNNPMWPDAQPWDTLVYVIAAVIVVLINRKTMLTRGAGATSVLMEDDGSRMRSGPKGRTPDDPVASRARP